MLPFLVTVFFFLVRVESSNYEAFSLANYRENNIENRKSNRVIQCDMEDIFNIVGLNEIQELIESLAAKKGTTPLSILRMLQKKMKNKEEMKMFNREAIYSLPSNTQEDDVVIIPVVTSQNRLPPVLKADFLARNEESAIFRNAGPSVSRMNQVFPGMFPLAPVKNNQFAATVRVNDNDRLITRDAIITVSPLMTLIEALRQAEIKYQNILGLSHETDIFTLSYSSIIDCYMVNQVDGVVNNEERSWQVTISDRDNQVVYKNFCLPNGRDAFVKPGTLISLSYVPVQ